MKLAGTMKTRVGIKIKPKRESREQQERQRKTEDYLWSGLFLWWNRRKRCYQVCYQSSLGAYYVQTEKFLWWRNRKEGKYSENWEWWKIRKERKSIAIQRKSYGFTLKQSTTICGRESRWFYKRERDSSIEGIREREAGRAKRKRHRRKNRWGIKYETERKEMLELSNNTHCRQKEVWGREWGKLPSTSNWSGFTRRAPNLKGRGNDSRRISSNNRRRRIRNTSRWRIRDESERCWIRPWSKWKW